MFDTERPKFEKALEKLLYATNGDRMVPPHHKQTYWTALKRYGIADVLRAMSDAMRETDSHVTPANLLSRVNPTTSFQESKNPAVVAERNAPARDLVEQWKDRPERERVFAQASVAFARRIADRYDAGHLVPESRVAIYDGDFEYMPAVMAAPLPSSSAWDEHVRCWAEFRRILREEWEQEVPDEAL